MRTALIIGASRGIGREFALQLLADGYKVFATAREDSSLAALRAEGAQALKIDVTRPDFAAGLTAHLQGQPLHLAVYVAGVFGPYDGATSSPAASDFDAVMHANVLGAMQAITQVAPLVEAAGGHFAFITSGMGSIGDTSSSMGWIYRASKAALNMAVHAAAFDYPKATLVVMNPGWVKTDMGGEGAPTSPQESVAGMRQIIQGLTLADSGSFHSYNGKKMVW